MAVNTVDHETFEAFLDALRTSTAVRLVKMSDYGFVSPLRTSSGAIVMAPQIKVVATAFDKPSGTLIRWQSTKRASAGVTVGIGTAKGIHGDVQVVATKADLRKWLELEGYAVSDGEWTPEELDRLLARK